MQTAVAKNAPRSEGLSAIVSELLAESYAQEQQLADVTLEQLGKLLEEASEEFERPGLPADLIPQAQSYERCKDAYCRILMELEQAGLSDSPSQTLGELRSSGSIVDEELTGIEQAQPAETAPAEKDDVTSFLDTAALDPAPRATTPVTQETIDSLFADLEQDIEREERTFDPDRKPVAPEPPTQAAFQALFADDRAPEPAEPAELATAIEIEPSPALDEGKESILDVPEPLAPQAPIAPQAPAVSDAAPRSTRAPWPLRAELAKEYARLASFFDELVASDTLPVGKHHGARLVAQALCFTVEAECAEVLLPGFRKVCAERAKKVQPLLKAEKGRLELPKDLRRYLDSLADENRKWIGDRKFPQGAVANSLRFMLALREPDNFRPSLFDYGLACLLFGQDTAAGQLALKNHLGLAGLMSNEVVELGLRLIGLQRLKNRVITPAPPQEDLDGLLHEQSEAEATAILKLLDRVETHGGD